MVVNVDDSYQRIPNVRHAPDQMKEPREELIGSILLSPFHI